MTLRPATPDDAEALSAVHAESFDQAWCAHEISDLLAAPGGYGLIVEGDGEIDAFILARAAAGEAEILTVAVRPRRRRGGLAAALVDAASGLARAAAAEALFLEVAVDNEAALGLYRAAGFAEVGRRPRYYRRAGGETVDALVLRRDLTP